MLDGNAVAGLLRDVFGREATTMHGTCAGCGRRATLAETAVYSGGPGVVVRCRGCSAVLMVLVERARLCCLDTSGFATLETS